MRLETKAYAKINWSLGICGERPDGYHELDMLMQRITLCDTLTFEPARFLELTVDGKKLGFSDKNLVLQAAQALNNALGLKKGARITLTKNIPARAGLGGGSADCAATLLALNKLWRLNLPLHTLEKIGLTLGADVPYCLHEEFCRVRGIGEEVSPYEAAPACTLVLVTPGGGLSTPQVFRRWNEKKLSGMLDNEALARALMRGDWASARALSRNDLEEPAIELMGEIGQLIQKFEKLGACYTRMSGSGSTVFAAFEDGQKARAAQAAVEGAITAETL